MSATTQPPRAAAPDTQAIAATAAPKKASWFRRATDRPGIVIGCIVLGAMVLFAIIGPLISGYDAYSIEPTNRYAPPSAEHWLGTDSFGRDVFTRVALGAQNSLFIGAAVTVIAAVIGVVVGLYSSIHPALDGLFMRITDGLVAFPAILLAMLITLSLGQSNLNVIVALSFVFAPMVARVVRSRVRVERQMSYVEVLRSQGASTTTILWRNILPNLLAVLTVQSTFIFGEAVLVEAALSFVGAGVPQPDPSWGGMVFEGRVVLETAWWLTVAPGTLLACTALATALIGDGIRDAYDPSFLPAGAVMRFRRWAKEQPNRRTHV